MMVCLATSGYLFAQVALTKPKSPEEERDQAIDQAFCDEESWLGKRLDDLDDLLFGGNDEEEEFVWHSRFT